MRHGYWYDVSTALLLLAGVFVNVLGLTVVWDNVCEIRKGRPPTRIEWAVDGALVLLLTSLAVLLFVAVIHR